MRYLFKVAPWFLMLLIASGCAGRKPIVYFSPDSETYLGLEYAVHPFIDGNSDKIDYPHAADIVTAAFESALLSAVTLVKVGDEDVSVYGTVTAFNRGTFGGRHTAVGFEVKAINKQTGKILWTASQIKSTKCDYNYEPSKYARELSREVVDQLLLGRKPLKPTPAENKKKPDLPRKEGAGPAIQFETP